MAANYNYHHDNYEPYCLAKARLMFIFVISDAHTREFALAEAACGSLLRWLTLRILMAVGFLSDQMQIQAGQGEMN